MFPRSLHLHFLRRPPWEDNLLAWSILWFFTRSLVLLVIANIQSDLSGFLSALFWSASGLETTSKRWKPIKELYSWFAAWSSNVSSLLWGNKLKNRKFFSGFLRNTADIIPESFFCSLVKTIHQFSLALWQVQGTIDHLSRDVMKKVLSRLKTNRRKASGSAENNADQHLQSFFCSYFFASSNKKVSLLVTVDSLSLQPEF